MSARALKIGLALSLVLNIFLLTGIGGALVMRHLWMMQSGALRPNSVMGLAKDMPPADQKALRQTLRAAVIASMPDLKAAHQARMAAADALAAPKPDRAVIDVNLQQARDAELRARAKMEAATVNYALTLAPQTRARIAESFRRPPPRAMRPHAPGGMHRFMHGPGPDFPLEPRPDGPGDEPGPPPPPLPR